MNTTQASPFNSLSRSMSGGHLMAEMLRLHDVTCMFGNRQKCPLFYGQALEGLK